MESCSDDEQRQKDFLAQMDRINKAMEKKDNEPPKQSLLPEEIEEINDQAQTMGNGLSELLKGHVTESFRQTFRQSATNMVKPLYQKIKELEKKIEELEKKIDGAPLVPFAQETGGSDVNEAFKVSGGIVVDTNVSIVLEETQVLMSSDEDEVMTLVREQIEPYLNGQNPRLEGLCSEVCPRLVVKLARWGKATRQVGFWIGGGGGDEGMNRCHEWIHLQMEGGTLVFDPTYVQFVATNQWSWNECKKAVQNCALLFQDDNARTEQRRRAEKRLPIKLEIKDY